MNSIVVQCIYQTNEILKWKRMFYYVLFKLYFCRLQSIKNSVLELVTEESQQWLGCAMTYTIFEALKEKIHELLEKQSEANDPNEVTEMVQEVKISDSLDDVKKNVVKKSQLTKAQKRRQWERTDGKGEKPRGWDWVDIVKHLSQTGSKDDGAVS